MKLYTAPQFLDAFGKAFFPGEVITLRDYRLDGKTWRLPVRANGKPVTTWEFIDFYEPVETPVTSDMPKVRHLHRASRGTVSDSEWASGNNDRTFEAAPFIRWAQFATWNDYVAFVGTKRARLFDDSARRYRKIRRELGGEVEFLYEDKRPETLKAMYSWKSKQFAHANAVFSNPENVAFIQHMVDSGFATVSSFSAGGKLMAAHIGVLLDGHFYSWVMAYDPECHAYGPGRLMVEKLMQHSLERGDTAYDFMLGGETFKWWYGTHGRLVAPLGGFNKTMLKWQVKKALAQHPALYNRVMKARGKKVETGAVVADKCEAAPQTRQKNVVAAIEQKESVKKEKKPKKHVDNTQPITSSLIVSPAFADK